jgi:hypothetical protein
VRFLTRSVVVEKGRGLLVERVQEERQRLHSASRIGALTECIANACGIDLREPHAVAVARGKLECRHCGITLLDVPKVSWRITHS